MLECTGFLKGGQNPAARKLLLIGLYNRGDSAMRRQVETKARAFRPAAYVPQSNPSIKMNSYFYVEMRLISGLLSSDVKLINKFDKFDEIDDVDVFVTLKKKSGQTSQKKVQLSRWQRDELIKVEGFDGETSNDPWRNLRIHGHAKHGSDTIVIDIYGIVNDTSP